MSIPVQRSCWFGSSGHLCTLSSWMPAMRLLIGKMWQPSSFSIKTPLGWLVPTKISFVLSPHRTMLYDTAPLLGINRNSFDFKASRDDLVESLEAAIAKQAQRIKRLVFIVRLLEAQWPQLNNCRPYIAAWKSLVILILRKTKKDMTLHCIARCATAQRCVLPVSFPVDSLLW